MVSATAGCVFASGLRDAKRCTQVLQALADCTACMFPLLLLPRVLCPMSREADASKPEVIGVSLRRSVLSSLRQLEAWCLRSSPSTPHTCTDISSAPAHLWLHEPCTMNVSNIERLVRSFHKSGAKAMQDGNAPTRPTRSPFLTSHDTPRNTC